MFVVNAGRSSRFRPRWLTCSFLELVFRGTCVAVFQENSLALRYLECVTEPLGDCGQHDAEHSDNNKYQNVIHSVLLSECGSEPQWNQLMRRAVDGRPTGLLA